MSKEQIDMSSGGYGQSDTSDSKSRNPTIMKKDHQFRRVILLVYRSGAKYYDLVNQFSSNTMNIM